MPPNAEKEFIIVLKAPTNKIKYNLASYLVLKSANGIRRLHSSNKIEEKRIKKAGNDLEDIEIEFVILKKRFMKRVFQSLAFLKSFFG